MMQKQKMNRWEWSLEVAIILFISVSLYDLLIRMLTVLHFQNVPTYMMHLTVPYKPYGKMKQPTLDISGS